jgi:PAS domain S-box-containing protein
MELVNRVSSPDPRELPAIEVRFVDLFDEERKRWGERQLSALIDSIPALVWRADVAGDLTYLNQRARNYVGLAANDEIPARIADRAHVDDAPGAEAAYGEAVSKGQATSFNCRLERFDGIFRWFEVRLQPTFDDDGVLDTWYGFAVDIDERMRLHEQAQANQAALERASRIATTAELSASIAHEINQPLAAIAANNAACRQWLAADPPNIERVKIAVERIARDTEGVSGVVARVKALFKRGQPLRSRHDLNSIVTGACALLTNELSGADIRLTRFHAPSLPPIWVDQVQIQQLIVNLIRNAVDAIQTAGGVHRAITVETRRTPDEFVGLRVIDSGPGFVDVDKAFNAFYTTKEHGMGIGLAICKSIAEAHHGRLVASNDSAVGTILDLTLPVGPPTDARRRAAD